MGKGNILRLRVLCEDRVGLTYELLNILARQNLNLHGIELDVSGCIYLSFPQIEFDDFSQLMTAIRKISGVNDVRCVEHLPIEKERNEFAAIFNTQHDPLVFLNDKGNIQYRNHAFDHFMTCYGLKDQSNSQLEKTLNDMFAPDLDLQKFLLDRRMQSDTKLIGQSIEPTHFFEMTQPTKANELNQALHLKKRSEENKEAGIGASNPHMAINGGTQSRIIYRQINRCPYQIYMTPVFQNQLSEFKTNFLGVCIQIQMAYYSENIDESHQSLGFSLHQSDAFDAFYSQSERFNEMIEQAKKFSKLDVPLLIQGETGTGKEMLARACHLNSKRANSPFLVVNCISIPDEAVESELFGCIESAESDRKKGQLEQANGGTVFLDGVSEMSPHLQMKLLRFLQDGRFRRVGEEQEIYVDVRVICASQKCLSDLVAENIFRDDLYYRLSVLSLTILPLRERTEDIGHLTMALVVQLSREIGNPIPKIHSSAEERLKQYAWPGNVRQLRNILLSVISQLEKCEITADDLHLIESDQQHTLTELELEGSLEEMMHRHEAKILANLYEIYPSSRKLAKRLNISHTAVANKLRQYGLTKK